MSLFFAAFDEGSFYEMGQVLLTLSVGDARV
jgi:hypothetical protein